MFSLDGRNGFLRLVLWMAPSRSSQEGARPSPKERDGPRNGAAGESRRRPLDVDDRFHEIFATYFDPVFRLFLRRGIPRESARDLTQETFLRVYRGIERFRGEASVRTWVFHIAANVWRNEVRRLRTEKREAQEVSLQALTESGPQIAADRRFAGWAGEPGALEEILEDERRKKLHEALRNLPARMRRCVLLRIHGGLKYREIAVLMGTSIETVKSQLSQAQGRLETELGHYFDSFDL